MSNLTEDEIEQVRLLLQYEPELLQLAEQIHARGVLAKTWGKRILWTTTILTAIIMLRDSLVATVKAWFTSQN